MRRVVHTPEGTAHASNGRTKWPLTNPEGEEEILRAVAPNGAGLASVLASGAWLSDHTDAGVVLRDPEGGYWRLVVAPNGAQ